jgi:RNA polymerase sigma factor (sigma-70 family)
VSANRSNRETFLPLLHDTQAYLQQLLDQKVPDSVLSVAWDEFYRVYDDLIRRFVISREIPSADVDDCVQEVWREVILRLVDFQRPADRPGLRAWLYTLVRAKTANVLRDRAKRAADSIEQATAAGREPSQGAADPANLFEQKWELALLESSLEELRQQISDVNYRILRMRLLEERSVAEVAAQLELSPEQVRYRYHRVIRKLKTYLAVFTGQPFGARGPNP